MWSVNGGLSGNLQKPAAEVSGRFPAIFRYCLFNGNLLKTIGKLRGRFPQVFWKIRHWRTTWYVFNSEIQRTYKSGPIVINAPLVYWFCGRTYPIFGWQNLFYPVINSISFTPPWALSFIRAGLGTRVLGGLHFCLLLAWGPWHPLQNSKNGKR